MEKQFLWQCYRQFGGKRHLERDLLTLMSIGKIAIQSGILISFYSTCLNEINGIWLIVFLISFHCLWLCLANRLFKALSQMTLLHLKAGFPFSCFRWVFVREKSRRVEVEEILSHHCNSSKLLRMARFNQSQDLYQSNRAIKSGKAFVPTRTSGRNTTNQEEPCRDLNRSFVRSFIHGWRGYVVHGSTLYIRVTYCSLCRSRERDGESLSAPKAGNVFWISGGDISRTLSAVPSPWSHFHHQRATFDLLSSNQRSGETWKKTASKEEEEQTPTKIDKKWHRLS